MDNKEFYDLLVELLEDTDIRYNLNYHSNMYICFLFNKHLSIQELNYIYYNWKAFYNEPLKYSMWKDTIINCLENLED